MRGAEFALLIQHKNNFMNLKFRVWDDKYKSFYFTDLDALFSQNDATRDLKSENTQQFTGLLDKNGKEIYEGDIMNVNPNWTAYASQRPIVILKDGCFYLDTMLLAHMHKSMQVIGNIFENPELIKK